MIERVLEPEVMDDLDEAASYNSMDHEQVNRVFAEDLLKVGEVGTDILDVGTGTALIPMVLCQLEPRVRIMASDASSSMLEIARYNLEVNQCMARVQLHCGDAKQMVFPKDYFDTVMSNSLVHHLPVHEDFFKECIRVLRPCGLLFVRDLVRPASLEELERLVQTYGGDDEFGSQMLRQSFYAALTVDEVRNQVAELGIPAECVCLTSDRHWTLSARANENKSRFSVPTVAAC